MIIKQKPTQKMLAAVKENINKILIGCASVRCVLDKNMLIKEAHPKGQ